MTRELILVRHAKSSWDNPLASDHERELSERGTQALPIMRRYLERRSVKPDLVACSPAKRSVATLEGIMTVLPADVEVRYDAQLYEGSSDQLLRYVAATPEVVQQIMIVGHNPALKGTIETLVASHSQTQPNNWSNAMPTGSIAILSFCSDWRSLRDSGAELADLFVPEVAE